MAPSCLWTGQEFVTPQGKVGTILTPLDFLPGPPYLPSILSCPLSLSLSSLPLFLLLLSLAPEYPGRPHFQPHKGN